MSSGPGGRREGAGRPPGSKAIRQSEHAVRLAMDGGETPFAIMLKVARALFKEAMSADGTTIIDHEKARDAAAVAKDAAPFVHPKLNAIALESSSDEPFVIRFDDADRNA